MDNIYNIKNSYVISLIFNIINNIAVAQHILSNNKKEVMPKNPCLYLQEQNKIFLMYLIKKNFYK